MDFRCSRRRAGSRLLLLVSLTGVWSCATEEIPRYGDPQRVGGGQGGDTGASTSVGGSTGGGGGECVVDTGCAVSFKTAIFPVLDGTSSCAFTPGCHGDGKGNLTLTAGDADGYYTALTALKLKDGSSNIVPCDVAGSKMLCNLRASDGENPYGKCGSQLMPINAAKAPTLADLKAIEDWIKCGAPNN